MIQPTISILMLGGAKRVSLAEQLIESGKRMGINIKIIGYELRKEVPLASLAEIEIGLKWNNPKIIDHITEISNKHQISVILPFVDSAISIATRCKTALPHVFIPTSDIELVDMMFDKSIAAEAFLKSSLSIPYTYTNEKSEIKQWIAKPRFGSASKGIKIISDVSEITDTENYLIQEYISDKDEYTVDCYISQKGECLCAVPRLRIETSGGEVVQTRTCKNHRIIEESRKVLSAYNFRGPITLQFLHDKLKDRFLLMEINPRLGGGVICSIFAGAPITDYILQETLSIPTIPIDNWKDNTLMTRYFKEVIFYEK